MENQLIPAAIQNDRVCGNCRYFSPVRASPDQIVPTYICKLAPHCVLIQLSAQAGQLRTVFPAVEATDSCGSFSPILQ